MTKANQPEPYRQLVLEAKIKAVEDTEYGYNATDVAELTTTIRLGGKFDRRQVTALVSNVIEQLIGAFDQGEQVDVRPVALPKWTDADTAALGEEPEVKP